MNNLVTRYGPLALLATTLLTGCPNTTTPTTPGQPNSPTIKPIPSTAPTNIAPVPAPSSIITSPTPFPGTGATPFPGTSANPGTNPSSNPNALMIQTTALPTAVLNFNYSTTLQVSGGSGSYRWNVTSGNLPAGLNLDPSTGQIFGQTSQTGTFSFDVQVFDNQFGTVSRQSLSLLVTDSSSGLNNLSILTSSLPSGVIDRRYSRNLEISGGTSPVSWSVSAGSLPDGISLNTGTGELSGTPTLRGEETFTVRVTDSRGQSLSKTLSITINRTDTDLSILTPTLPLGVLTRNYNRTTCGTALSGQLTVTGGDGTYNWSISKGSLPPGLSLSNTGLIGPNNEIPTTAGSYTFTAKVQDGEDNSASKVFTIDIDTVGVQSFTPSSGGEDLRVIVSGENLNNAAVNRVYFADQFSAIAATNFTDVNCHTLTTSVPTNAKPIGTITIRDITGNTTLGTSLTPFVAEDVVINEVFTSPASGESQFVELKNQGTSSVSIAGWQLHYTNSANTLSKFSLPSETPALAPGKTLVVYLNINGATTASSVFTGTTFPEMRFDPLNGTATDALTQVGLCAGACTTTATTTNFRDYLQFGPAGNNTDPTAGDFDALETAAVSAGIWADNQTIDMTQLTAPLLTVSANSAAADAAHYGVLETNRLQSGLLVQNGNTKFDGYTGEAVLYYSPTTGAQTTTQQRVKRTVTGTGVVGGAGEDDNRVRLSGSLFQTSILATNTGNGFAGNGISVADVSLFAPTDFINVIAGGTIRTITALQTGPKLELDTVLSAGIQAGNTSDGVNQGGFLVDNATLLAGSTSLNIAVRQVRPVPIAGEFTVTRTPTNINTTTNRVTINQALSTISISGANDGDGTSGNPIQLTAVPTNFITGDRALYNGNLCIGAATCQVTFGADQVQLLAPVAQLQVPATNLGVGTTLSPLQVSDVTGFKKTDKVLVNGQGFSITDILPAFGGIARVVLSAPLKLSIANTLGDGSLGNGIQVTSTDAFVANGLVKYRSFPNSTISSVLASPARIELTAPIATITLTGSAGTGTAAAPLQVNAPAAAFQAGDNLRAPTGKAATITTLGTSLQLSTPLYKAETVATGTPTTTVINVGSATGFVNNNFVEIGGEIRQFTVAGNTLTVSPALPTAPAAGVTVKALLANGDSLSLAPLNGDLVPVGGGTPYNLNLVPTSGNFTLVPINPAQDLISQIPTSGSIFLAPKSGVLSKYLSIKYSGTNNQAAADYTQNTAPNAGQ